MIELNFHPLMGIFDELYRPHLQSLSLDPLTPNGRWALERANGLFWAQHLAVSELDKLVELAQKKFRYTACPVPQFEAVLSKPSLFVDNIVKAPAILANQGSSPQRFFSAVETLTILCALYSDLVYKPFLLTIEEGFLLNESSSHHLVENCLNPSGNPYFRFIIENCWPVVEATRPDLVWLLGPIRFSTFTLAMLTRKAMPNTHIAVVGHSSEYYSLNKIIKYLKSNHLLFSIIDSIILDDTEHTQVQLTEALETGTSLDSVANLLYIDRVSREIRSTRFEVSQKNVSNWVSTRPQSFSQAEELDDNVIDPSEVINVKLWPDARCYWNRCTFCGINQKYHTLPDWNSFEDVDEKAELVSQLVKDGCRYFWLIDEAVPPKVLESLAHSLVQHKLDVQWQARSKIDEGFSQAVCDVLAKAGLKEIRLGLESASYRILGLMDKFPEGFDLKLVEQIVDRFHRNGVSVHFPIIVGFPTETSQERSETYEFLEYLKSNYPSVTFNVNALGLDVASILFRKYPDFDITSIKWPCPARFYLGNLIEWDSDIEHFDKEAIDAERSNFMHQVLYPWIPATAMTPAYIFYRLSETSRITLVWKSHPFFLSNDVDPQMLSLDTKIQTSSSLAFTQLNRTRFGSEQLYRVYDWNSHNFLECDENGMKILKTFAEPHTIRDGLGIFHSHIDHERPDFDELCEKYLAQIQIAYEHRIVRVYDG